MPYKVMLSVQKTPEMVVDPSIIRAAMNSISERSISPRGAHGEYLGGADPTHIEIFPFNKLNDANIATANKLATTMNSLEPDGMKPSDTNPRNTEHNFGTPHEAKQRLHSVPLAES